MSERRPQTVANHAKFDPLFHFFLAPVLLGCFIASIVFLFHGINALHIWLAVFSLAAFLLSFKTRVYSLKVQDRVIRLEERLRLSALLSEALEPGFRSLPSSSSSPSASPPTKSSHPWSRKHSATASIPKPSRRPLTTGDRITGESEKSSVRGCQSSVVNWVTLVGLH